jgi:hypothetical protein
MNDILIQFQGFHPSEFTRAYLDLKLSELHGQAPYGAILMAVFTRKRKVLTANVRIMSAAGYVFAQARGTGLREVSYKISARVRKKFNRWKSLRRRQICE